VVEPLVSVVVSTFDRPERLRRLLDGLRSQTLDRSRFELIVVDDGSPPETAAVLAAERERGELALHILRHEHSRGPAAGRNSGWRAARGALVAFTDDDCAPAAGWLAALVAAAAADPETILQGRTEPDPRERPAANQLLLRSRSIARLGPQYETCNIAYPRAILEELDGFDERFGPGSPGEDTDLAWRAIERGHRAAVVSDARVHHAVIALGVSESLRDAIRWGRCARVFARHPDARVMLYRRVFWNVWHYLLIRSILALAAPAWLRRFLVTRHLLILAGRAKGAGAGLHWVAYLLAYDAVEAAGMVSGAVRHRTPLL
jgi:glycosyltransferase involved in cell wall biosynthesis